MSEEKWSPEGWAWEQIRNGKIADFNAHFEKTLDPQDPQGWGDDRKLSVGLLRQFFFEKPYKDEIPPEGVRIVGALFREGQVLKGARLDRQVWLDKCRFERPIDFESLKSDSLLSLEASFVGQAHGSPSVNLAIACVEGRINLSGVTVGGALNGSSLQVGQSLLMDEKATFKGDVILVGAKIEGQLDMRSSTFEQIVNGSGLQVGQNLFMREKATFKGDVILVGAKIEGQLDMSGSTFEQIVNGSALQVGQSLFMHEKATFKGDVILVTAKIEDQLTMRSSTFERSVDGAGLQVGQSLFMHEEATFKGDVVLITAKIEGQLAMNGSTFEQIVNGNSLQVGQDLLMHEEATFKGDVTLQGAKIEGQLNITGSTFEQIVNGNSLQVGQNLFMLEATFGKPASLVFARIGGNLDVCGAKFAGLDLTGAGIARELRLAGHGWTVSWQAPSQDGPTLKLRNVQVGALQDTPGAWPSAIDLEGFSYGHLGGFGATEAEDARNRSTDHWKAWLAKDGSQSKRYSPRPYTQLASVLVAAGRRDQATAIQFAGRERERKAARRQGRWRQWLWLTTLRYLCGYGLGVYIFYHVLPWIIGSVALGTTVLWRFAPCARAKGIWWCIGASLDRLLPVIQLNKEFADFFNDPHRERVAGWVIGVFAGLGLWGWVLGSFLIAALAGLTQRT